MNVIKNDENYENYQSLKIGEIYLEEDYEEPNEITLKFNCDLCDLTTENFQLFFKHIKLNHIKNNDVPSTKQEQKKYKNCQNGVNAGSAENFNFTSEYTNGLNNDIDGNSLKLKSQIKINEKNLPAIQNENTTSMHINSDYKLILEENETISNIEDSNSYIDSTERDKTYLRISFQTEDSNDYVFEESDEQINAEQDEEQNNAEQDDELSYQEGKRPNSTDTDNQCSSNFVKIEENAMEFEYEEIENNVIIKVDSHQSTYEKYIEDETYESCSNQETIITEEAVIFNENLESTDKSDYCNQQKSSTITPDNYSQNIEYTETDSLHQNLDNYEDFIEEDPENNDNIQIMDIIMANADVKNAILNNSNESSTNKESICNGSKSNVINNKIFYECNKCNKILPDHDQLILHNRIHDGNKLESNKYFECCICSKVFNKISNWKSHLAYHSGERNYPCSFADCQRSFIQNNDRRKHERRVHLRERNHTCEVCAKKFYIFSELREHKRIHDPDDKYECTVCEAKFNSKRRFQSHRLTHENKNGSYCSYCNINFATVDLLKGHFETKHFSKLTVNQFCKICKLSFSSVELLERHSKIKHRSPEN